MNDLSLHILDICENSIQAGAKNVEIIISEDSENNLLTLEIKDDGRGMDAETVEKIKSPFETSRTTRSVGLGIPFLKESAEDSGGNLMINSELGKGTSVKATFLYNHIDRKPLGDMSETLIALMLRADKTEISYLHGKNGKEFSFSTKDLKEQLGVKDLNQAYLLNSLKKVLKQKLTEIQ